MFTLFILLVLGIVSFSPPHDHYRNGYAPVFMKRADLEKSVSYQSEGQPMKDPGKIYVRGTDIFINEKYKGVHIIDNSNPLLPTPKAFITVPGCIDMAVKGSVIYMDNAVDLVAFDLDTKEVTKRIRDFMPEHYHPDGYFYYFNDRPQDMILVGWKKVSDND